MEQLAKIETADLVYADEAGMDNRTGRETRPVMNMLMGGMKKVKDYMHLNLEEDKGEST